MLVLNAKKQHLGVNFGDICRFEHRFFIWFFGGFYAEEIWVNFYKSNGNSVAHAHSFIMAGQHIDMNIIGWLRYKMA